MGIFKRLFSGGNPGMPKASKADDPNAYWLYVQCGKCGAPVAVRVDTRNDVSIDYDSGGRFLRKEIMDSTCFQLMYTAVQFDGNGTVMSQTIERGKFLTEEEYRVVKEAFEARKRGD